MRTLIFPDLHEPPDVVLDRIEDTIAHEKPDRTVFLGDYFDRYNDTPTYGDRMARWLITSLGDKSRTHLIGNHDASYLWPSEATVCPGWTIEKQSAVSGLLGLMAGERFEFHVWIDGWLLTHAGLAQVWVPEEVDVADYLDEQSATARVAFGCGRDHWYVAVGPRRGGRDPAGGILWCDWHELRWPVNQIFGHTPYREVRRDSASVCLDTNLGDGPQHYAVVTDGQVEIRVLK